MTDASSFTKHESQWLHSQQPSCILGTYTFYWAWKCCSMIQLNQQQQTNMRTAYANYVYASDRSSSVFLLSRPLALLTNSATQYLKPHRFRDAQAEYENDGSTIARESESERDQCSFLFHSHPRFASWTHSHQVQYRRGPLPHDIKDTSTVLGDT
jgi:hypothetical protein